MELIFWTSVGLSIVAVAIIIIMVIQFYNLPNPLRMLLIATLKLACTIFMALLIIASFLFFAILLRKTGRYVDEEDMPGCDIDYSERPYIAKEQYN